MLLETLTIENFKCFGHPGIDLQLRPLTIFVGPNGSGKSSVLDSLGFLMQTTAAQNVGTRNGFLWQGSQVNLGHHGEFAFHRRNPNLHITIGLTFSAKAFANWWRDKERDARPIVGKNIGYAVSYRPSTREWRHSFGMNGIERVETRTNVLRSGIPSGETIQSTLTFENIPFVFNPTRYDMILAPEVFFPAQMPNGVDPKAFKDARRIAEDIGGFLSFMADALSSRSFIVSGERAPFRIDKQEEHFRPTSVGRTGETTIEVLSALFASGDGTDQTIKIQQWAKEFGLPNLKGGWTGAKKLEANYKDPEIGPSLPVEFSGFGSRQILPIITQLFAAPVSSLIMIEEPEISLHPEAQLSLVRMFGDVVKNRDQQLIVTTHSATLLLGLQELSTCGLTPSDIAVYHFDRSDGASHAQLLPLTDSWSITGWVPSFAEVESRLIKEWAAKLNESKS